MKFSIFVVLAAGLLLAGCASAPRTDYAPTLARFFLETPGGSVGMTLPQSGVQLTVAAKPVLTEFDFADVAIMQVELGRCLMFRLTPAAARDLYRLTVQNQGHRLVLAVNGAPLGARRIERPFDDGTVLVFAEIADAELPALVENMRKSSAELQRAVKKS